MFEIGQIVNYSIILVRALSDSPNLSVKMKESLRRLCLLGSNSAKITKIENIDGITLTLQVQNNYNGLPAVMCEGYNGGQGVICYFETEAQAETLLNNETQVDFTNLSANTIETQQLVRMIYNNKHFVIIPVMRAKKISDYKSVIGRAAAKILPYQTGKISLLDISQAMDLNSFHRLTIRHFGS